MIYWMSENTANQLDRFGIAVFGFDPEREGENASCMVEWGDDEDECGVVVLGDIRLLSDMEIDRRFAAGLVALAEYEGNERLEEAATLCLAPHTMHMAG